MAQILDPAFPLSHPRSPVKLQRELDLSPWGGRCGQHTRGCERSSSAVKHVRMAESYRRHFEVGMIHDIEEFSSELHIEALRNSLDRLIFKNREIQVRRSRPGQEVATSVAAKVEALRRWSQEPRSAAWLGVWWSWVAISSPSIWVGPGGDSKALGLDVVGGISWIGES